MILVDSSVWVDHLRRADAALVEQLEQNVVLTHPFVIGELACGRLARREAVLSSLAALPSAPVATHAEALSFAEIHALAGRGVGWLDVHLLAAAALAGGALLWSRDKKLAAVALELGLAARLH